MSSFSNVPDMGATLLRIQVRHFVMVLPFVVLSSGVSLGADSRAIAVLKEKGLTRSGRFFVIEAEEPVLQKWQETRAVLASYTAAAGRKNEVDLSARELAQLEERRAELQEKLNDLNQQINEQGFQPGNNRPGGFGQGSYVSQLIAQRNMIRMSLSEINAMQKPSKDDVKLDQKALEAETKNSLETARAFLAEFRKAVDQATKEYDKLSTDTAVIEALHTLEKDKIGTFKLGPSTSFKSAVKTLENAERMVLAKKSTTVRKKGKPKR